MDWTQTAFVFPGQGSQVLGMGKDLAEAYELVRLTFAEADEAIGYKLSAMMADGPEAELYDTQHTQPALYVMSIATLRLIQQHAPQAIPAMTAGHSLGEFTALTAAGALDFVEGVRLVAERGRLMRRAGELSPGAMAAILNLDAEAVRAVCRQASEQVGKPVVLANDNCPGQIVISGSVEAVERAMQLAKEAGAKRALRLNVSTAPHSPLMAVVEGEFAARLRQTRFQTPRFTVYAASTGQPLHDVAAIYADLESQLTQPVYWTATVQAMIAAGARTFVEIGSKDVLTGLLKRIDPTVDGWRVGDVASLRAFLDALN